MIEKKDTITKINVLFHTLFAVLLDGATSQVRGAQISNLIVTISDHF